MFTAKREPPYSKVTARESLDNIRKRQAAEREAAALQAAATTQPIPEEYFGYDHINYDVIKVGIYV